MIDPHAPVFSACSTCGVMTVGRKTLANRTPEGRQALRAQGFQPRRAGQCQRCFSREVAHDATLEPRAVERMGREILLAEWSAFHDSSASIAENCRRIAPRLGMRWRSMERALYRAGITQRDAA